MTVTQIPAELAERNQWVVWRSEKRHHKWTKVPYNARTGLKASSTDPRTWSSFAEAVLAAKDGRYKGIGFVFSPDDDICGVDLDKCRDPKTGTLEAWATRIVDELKSYTEVSPSGRGLHVFVSGQLPAGQRRKGNLEMYDSGRYFTVTGEHLPGTPESLNVRSAELTLLHERVFGQQQPPRAVDHVASVIDDEAVVEKASRAANGAKFTRLWNGNWGEFQSQSEADLALCAMLAYRCGGDPARIDRLFRQSGLFRGKWDERRSGDGRTYGALTIEKALSAPLKVGEECDLPEIQVNHRPLPEITTEVVRAFEGANQPPKIFVRAAKLTRLTKDEHERPILEAMSESQVRHHMARCAFFMKCGRDGWEHVFPPSDVVRDVMAQGRWPLPPVEAIVEVPVLRADGTVVDVPGYDRATGLIYCPEPKLSVPVIPQSPTMDDVRRALGWVDETIGQFPFADDASKANTLALMLTPIVLPATTGVAPLALIDSPKQGTGKGLLSEVVSLTATGRSAALMTAPDNDEEWRKRLAATLWAGSTIITIDNIEGALMSPSLAAVLTANPWKDRLLGKSEMLTMPQRATWIATGNNVRLAGDLARRCYWIRLDSKLEKPWIGRQFRHPNLPQWVREHRGQLVAALTTLARAWYAAGRPAHETKAIGSFEPWCRTIGSILAHAGVSGFLGNLGDMYVEADEEGPQWEAFLACWYNIYDETPVTVGDVIHAMNIKSAFKEALPDTIGADFSAGDFRKQLGQALSRHRNAPYGEYQLERLGQHSTKKVATWRVVQKDTPAIAAAA